MSVVGTLRAASVFDTSLSTLILCVRNKTSVWWLYISRKERRERGVLISLTVHAGAGDVASFTTTGERRGRGGQMKQLYQFNGVISRSALRSLVAQSQRPLQP